MAFEVEQRFPHGITLSAHALVSVGVAVREGGGGRRRGTLECRAGQTEKVRRADQKGLQSYISRHLREPGQELGVRERVGGVGGWRKRREGRDFYISHLADAFIPSDSRGKKIDGSEKKQRKEAIYLSLDLF